MMQNNAFATSFPNLHYRRENPRADYLIKKKTLVILYEFGKCNPGLKWSIDK